MKLSALLLSLSVAAGIATAVPLEKRTMSEHVSRPESWVGKDVLIDLSGQETKHPSDGEKLAPRWDTDPGTPNLPLPLAWYTQAAALSQACYCQGVYLNPGTRVGDATLLSHTGDGTDEQQVLVFASDSLGIVLGYQGTNSSALESLWHDVDFIWKHPASALGNVPSGALVDRGFQEAFLATWPTVQTLVSQAQQQYPGRKLTIVGHSLGAAIAEIAAVAYGSQVSNVITFGQPRVGNNAWASYFNQLFGPNKANHVTNGRDWVPHVVPYAFGARQPEGEIWINPANSNGWMYYPGTEDKKGADSVAYDLQPGTEDHEGTYFGVHIAGKGANCPVAMP